MHSETPRISLMKSDTNLLHHELLSHPGQACGAVHIIKHVERCAV